MVASRLSEPLWHGGAHMRLMVHCIQLHTVLECEAVEALSLDDICAQRPRVRQLIEDIFNDAALLHTAPSALMRRSGLARMCPLMSHCLGNSDEVPSPSHPRAPLPRVQHRSR